MSSECCEVHCHERDFHFLCIILSLENMSVLYRISIFLSNKSHLVAPSSGKSTFEIELKHLSGFWRFVTYLIFYDLFRFSEFTVVLTSLMSGGYHDIWYLSERRQSAFSFSLSILTLRQSFTTHDVSNSFSYSSELHLSGCDLCWSAEPVWIHWAAVLLVHAFRPRLSPEQLTAPAGHNASVDLGPELVTCSVYFYCDEVKDGQQKYCAV